MATQMMYPSTSMTSTTSSNAASTIANLTGSLSEDPSSTDEAVQKMQSNLVRYARAQDRRMVLRSLKDVKFLSSLTMELIQPSEEIELIELEKEVCDESVILNCIPFKPVGRDVVGTSRASNCTLPMLKGVCEKLCDMATTSGVESAELYGQLVLRLAKTTSSADPYFYLNSLLGSSDLMVMPLTPENVQSFGKAPRSKNLQKLMAQRKDAPQANPPIQLNVYAANGHLHITLSQTHKYGLFRKSDVNSGRPWIAIDAVVNERTNMSTSKGVRSMNVKLPELY
mmetsp:Transcript_25819/g.39614  ORF Transcript_25819/g.39614 Transcript_25819/m.39614 type:complete len:283 (+) Transcript_25819:103-951(+)